MKKLLGITAIVIGLWACGGGNNTDDHYGADTATGTMEGGSGGTGTGTGNTVDTLGSGTGPLDTLRRDTTRRDTNRRDTGRRSGGGSSTGTITPLTAPAGAATGK